MKIKKNGKVINLTESDLKRIVKRTLTELKSLNESITVNDVKMSSANPTSGGPLKTLHNNTTNLYSVVVDTIGYDGKVGIKNIYKKGSKYYMKTNAKQEFELEINKLKYITTQIKKGAKTIKVTQGTWPLDAKITFTKK